MYIEFVRQMNNNKNEIDIRAKCKETAVSTKLIMSCGYVEGMELI